jgi:pyridoxamine 5'-phosphate oxidase
MKDLRQNYTKSQLMEENALSSPFEMFTRWFEEAQNGNVIEPNAMTLSTASRANHVDSRTVLLKGVRDEEFVFFTNYYSNKGKHLKDNPNCSLLFLWLPMERQIVIRGKATKISAEESDEYYHSRPVESRIGAWASNQSEEIESRDALEDKLQEKMAFYNNKEVSRPGHWGGYAVAPFEIEFWQGRANRLHDRLLYRLEDKTWKLVRLQP